MTATRHAARRAGLFSRFAAYMRTRPPLPASAPSRVPVPPGLGGTLSHMYVPAEKPHGIARPEVQS